MDCELPAQITVRTTWTAELEAAANAGNAQAQFQLARCYKEGWGVDKSEQLTFLLGYRSLQPKVIEMPNTI